MRIYIRVHAFVDTRTRSIHTLHAYEHTYSKHTHTYNHTHLHIPAVFSFLSLSSTCTRVQYFVLNPSFLAFSSGAEYSNRGFISI